MILYNVMNLTLKWSDEDLCTGKNGIIVLVDTLRASTVIPVSLYSGAKEIIVVKEEHVARSLKAEHPEFILAGERNGNKLEGFDCGNSPYYLKDHSKNKSVVLTTSNFCNVIEKVSNLGLPVLAASLVNAEEIAKYINSLDIQLIEIIATGTYYFNGRKCDKPFHSKEDLIAGLFICYELSKMEKITMEKINENIFIDHLDILNEPDTLINFLWETRYAKYLLDLDNKKGENINREDMEICFGTNNYPCVPFLDRTEDLLMFKNSSV
jgi:phosphosulfolactate phosphohydrolase-like enzyme